MSERGAIPARSRPTEPVRASAAPVRRSPVAARSSAPATLRKINRFDGVIRKKITLERTKNMPQAEPVSASNRARAVESGGSNP